ncbi:hypothetical protein J6590_049549 [Homalodisca vitripennis]|nr:hypothetical protein J6590_049549 [Homalodisca vitripennis]
MPADLQNPNTFCSTRKVRRQNVTSSVLQFVDCSSQFGDLRYLCERLRFRPVVSQRSPRYEQSHIQKVWMELVSIRLSYFSSTMWPTMDF